MKGLNSCSMFIVHGTEMIRVCIYVIHVMDVHCAYATLYRNHLNNDAVRETERQRKNKWMGVRKNCKECYDSVWTLCVLLRIQTNEEEREIVPKTKAIFELILCTVWCAIQNELPMFECLARQFGTNGETNENCIAPHNS